MNVHCPSCLTCPRDRWHHATYDGHAVILTGTGLASACSGDGGYYPCDHRASRQTKVRVSARVNRMECSCGAVRTVEAVGPKSVPYSSGWMFPVAKGGA